MVTRGPLAPTALATLVALILLVAPAASAAGSGILVLDEGRFLLDDADAPPPGDRPWAPVALPDRWAASRPGVSGVGWYLFRVSERPALAARFGIYLPSLDQNAAVFLNGSWIGESGPPGTFSWHRPLYLAFPPELLRDGENEIAVRLETYGTPGSGLERVELGPDALLEPRWRGRYWLQVRVAQLSTVLALFFGGLFGVIWFAKSRDPVFGYFALALAFWGINGLDYHVREVPFPFWVWRWLAHAALDWTAVFFVFLVSRVVFLERPRLERALLLFGLVATALPGVARPPTVSPSTFQAIVNTTHVVSAALMVHCLWLVVRHRRRLPRRELWIYAAVGVGMNVIILRDFGIQFGLLPRGAPRIFQFAAPLMFLAFGSALLLRFIEAYSRAEETTRELEARVREKEAELLRHYERVRDLERREILATERERITREMHDGMGGQLVSTLAMVEADSQPGAVAEALRSSLDEMRLVIHSLDPLVEGVEHLLALTRERLEPRLRRRGVRFDWRVADLLPTPAFGPEQYVHLLRILQEAITNALKHASARVITVSSGVRAGDSGVPGIFVSIADDGVGIPADRRRGLGLENMAFRARQLGGTLRLESAEPGVRVEVWFPTSR